MKVIKQENEFGLIISFKELDKQFDVSFSGNGDLYWTICSENVNDDNNFIITKENYEVYRLFEELFDDIENIKISKDTKASFKKNFIDRQSQIIIEQKDGAITTVGIGVTSMKKLKKIEREILNHINTD